jgi:hypothetical protein
VVWSAVELEAEVTAGLDGLADDEFDHVEHYIASDRRTGHIFGEVTVSPPPASPWSPSARLRRCSE